MLGLKGELTLEERKERDASAPVENPRIAAFKAALAALTYSDMMGIAVNIQMLLPIISASQSKPATHSIAEALASYARGK